MTRVNRILYVHNSADIYGASRSLLRLLPRVRERGYDPLVVLPSSGPLRDQIDNIGVRVVVDPRLSVIDRGVANSRQASGLILGFPASVRNLFRLIKKEQIWLVHTNTGVMPAPALAARLAGIPHVWHIRDNFQEFRLLWSVYRHYITALSNHVICVSNAIAGQFPKARNVKVIHNGLPLEEFPANVEELRAGFREKHRLGDAVVAGCVGRIKFVRKGQEVLVQAAAMLKQRGVAAKYLIVGTTAPGNEEHLPRLQRHIRDLGVGSDFILTGELVDPRPAFAAMDILVLPSAQAEPFGGVVLEAMAMRRPVIATAVGGSLDQVADGQTGYLVPASDPVTLAEKIEALVRDADLRHRFGQAGRQRLEQCFSIEQMLQNIERLYKEGRSI